MEINISLFCLSRCAAWILNRSVCVCCCIFIHLQVYATQCAWCRIYRTCVFSVSYQSLLLLLDNNYQRPLVTCLLSLSFSSGKWQINILFLDRYLLCVRGKASWTRFIHTQYTIWVTAYISCLNKSSFLCGCKKERETLFVFIIYSYLPRWVCYVTEECRIY